MCALYQVVKANSMFFKKLNVVKCIIIVDLFWKHDYNKVLINNNKI
jgi:hypothetical protein